MRCIIILCWLIVAQCGFGQGTSYRGNFTGNGGVGPVAGQTGLTNIPPTGLRATNAPTPGTFYRSDGSWQAAPGGGGGGVSTFFNVQNTNYAGGADPTGVKDSTAAYFSAKAAKDTAGGGTIYWPVGTYTFTNGGLIETSGGTWLGDGAGNLENTVRASTVLVNKSTTNSLVFNAAPTRFEGICFSNSNIGFSAVTSGAFITATNLNDTRVKTDVEWCGFTFGYIGIDIQDGSDWTIQNNWIQDMSYDYIRLNNRAAPSQSDSWILHNTMAASGEPCRSYIEINGGGGYQIMGNWMVGAGANYFQATNGVWIHLTNNSPNSTSEILIQDNFIESCSSNSVFTDTALGFPAGAALETLIVSGNDFNSYWTNNNYPVCATMGVGRNVIVYGNVDSANYNANPPKAWLAVSNISIYSVGDNSSVNYPGPAPYVVLDSGLSCCGGAMGVYDGQPLVYGPNGLIITNAGGGVTPSTLLTVRGAEEVDANGTFLENIFQTNAIADNFSQQTTASGNANLAQYFNTPASYAIYYTYTNVSGGTILSNWFGTNALVGAGSNIFSYFPSTGSHTTNLVTNIVATATVGVGTNTFGPAGNLTVGFIVNVSGSRWLLQPLTNSAGGNFQGPPDIEVDISQTPNSDVVRLLAPRLVITNGFILAGGAISNFAWTPGQLFVVDPNGALVPTNTLSIASINGLGILNITNVAYETLTNSTSTNALLPGSLVITDHGTNAVNIGTNGAMFGSVQSVTISIGSDNLQINDVSGDMAFSDPTSVQFDFGDLPGHKNGTINAGSINLTGTPGNATNISLGGDSGFSRLAKNVIGLGNGTQGSTNGSLVMSNITANVENVFNVTQFGVFADGHTDQTAATLAVFALAQAGNGRVYFPGAASSYFYTNYWNIPNFASTPPYYLQNQLYITGDGHGEKNYLGPTQIEFNIVCTNTNSACIQTFGFGRLEINDIDLNNDGSNGMIFTSDTVLHLHDAVIRGNTTYYPTGIRFGGTNVFTAPYTPSLEQSFSGYGTKIENVTFGTCGELFHGGATANFITIHGCDNYECAANNLGTWDGTPYICQQDIIYGNQWEMYNPVGGSTRTGYTNGWYFTNCTQLAVFGDSFEDTQNAGDTATTNCIFWANNSLTEQNSCGPNHTDGAPICYDPGRSRNGINEPQAGVNFLPTPNLRAQTNVGFQFSVTGAGWNSGGILPYIDGSGNPFTVIKNLYDGALAMMIGGNDVATFISDVIANNFVPTIGVSGVSPNFDYAMTTNFESAPFTFTSPSFVFAGALNISTIRIINTSGSPIYGIAPSGWSSNWLGSQGWITNVTDFTITIAPTNALGQLGTNIKAVCMDSSSVYPAGGGGAGTVTSVAFAPDAAGVISSVSGSPVATTGTITPTFSANIQRFGGGTNAPVLTNIFAVVTNSGANWTNYTTNLTGNVMSILGGVTWNYGATGITNGAGNQLVDHTITNGLASLGGNNAFTGANTFSSYVGLTPTFASGAPSAWTSNSLGNPTNYIITRGQTNSIASTSSSLVWSNQIPFGTFGAGTNAQWPIYFTQRGQSLNGAIMYASLYPGFALITNNGANFGISTNVNPNCVGAGAPSAWNVYVNSTGAAIYSTASASTSERVDVVETDEPGTR